MLPGSGGSGRSHPWLCAQGALPTPRPPPPLIGPLSHCCSQPEFALVGRVARSHHAPHCPLNLLECDFFSLASLPDAESDVYLLVLHPVLQGKTEMTGCVSGPLKSRQHGGTHRSPESRPDTGRRGEPYWPRVVSALLEVPDQNPEVKGHSISDVN